MFNPQLKIKRVIDRKYLDWVDMQGCVICGNQAKAHHICNTGRGSMGSKPDDHLTFALCSKHHMAWFDTGIHNNVSKWENEHELQTTYVQETLINAFQDGHINDEDFDIAYAQCLDLAERFR